MARQYKNARKSQKLIIKDAAAKLDVSPSTLGAWESERKAPSIESLEAMADLYQVSTDYLLGVESQQGIDLSGISEEEVTALKNLIKAMRNRH